MTPGSDSPSFPGREVPFRLSVRKPYAFQSKAIERVRNNRAVALYMEMRLGKTLCTIRGLKKCVRVLVIAPMAGLWAWKRELGLEGLGSHVQALLGPKTARTALLQRLKRWNLVNYEGIRAIPEILEEKWDAVVLDECRRIANPKAQITKLLLKWSRRFPNARKIILSGNPAPESPLEYFEQMRFLFGSFLHCANYWQFRSYYFREMFPHEWVPKPGAIQTIKGAIHEKSFILTRAQAGIRNTKVYEVRTVKLKPDTRRAYETVRREFLLSFRGRGIAETKWVPVQYLWLQQLASGFAGTKCVDKSKFRELLNLLTGELKDEQVVVWFRFNSGIGICRYMLERLGITNGVLQGSVSNEDRERAIDLFRDGTLRVLLAQVKVAREAIDLSNSSTSIYFSNSHSFDDRSQSEDRILNPAKKEPLLYLDLVSENTVDEDIVELLKEKKMNSRFFLRELLSKLKEGDHGG